MNRAASSLLISLASLALTTATLAQSPSQSPTIFTLATPSTSCPVGLSAQPGVGPGMVIVVTGKNTASQKLNLQLSNPRDMRSVTRAQITVHGLTPHGRFTPATSGDPDTATIAKQVDLVLTVAPGASTSTDLLFKGFTSIRWIDLDSLTYANGSTWHPSPQHNCHIVPNRVMLVASH